MADETKTEQETTPTLALEDQLSYWKGQAEALKSKEQELKDVIAQRDNFKNKYSILEANMRKGEVDPEEILRDGADISRASKADMLKTFLQVQKENEELKSQIAKEANERTLSQKRNALEKELRKVGFKENYLPKLDKFVNFDAVSLDSVAQDGSNVSAQMLIMSLKTEYPDMFGGVGASSKLPMPSSLQSQGQASAQTLQTEFDKVRSDKSLDPASKGRKLAEIAVLADNAGVQLR